MRKISRRERDSQRFFDRESGRVPRYAGRPTPRRLCSIPDRHGPPPSQLTDAPLSTYTKIPVGDGERVGFPTRQLRCLDYRFSSCRRRVPAERRAARSVVFQRLGLLRRARRGHRRRRYLPEDCWKAQTRFWLDARPTRPDHGVLVDIPFDSNVVGLVTPHQLPEDANVESGAQVSGYVLDVSRREGVVDFGMRPGLDALK